MYSIKDLENISGIKAHTIRIWEKRYNILEPMRTETNIRLYDSSNLQKLLNITLLHNHGYKISKISQYPSENIPSIVNKIITLKTYKSHAINAFKIAMLNFDEQRFHEAYDELLADKSFSEIFREVFIPLLNEVGFLWQTNTITAAHEHFLSNLIKQKLCVEIDKVIKSQKIIHEQVFILFLPSQETHDLGLKYLSYEIAKMGYRLIYLGENIEINDLQNIATQFDFPIYLMNVHHPLDSESLNLYIQKIQETILSKNTNASLWITGDAAKEVEKQTLTEQYKIFNSLDHILKTL